MCGDFTIPSLSLHSQILNLIRGCYVCGEGRFELLFGISKGGLLFRLGAVAGASDLFLGWSSHLIFLYA